MAPDFTLPAGDGSIVRLKDFRGKNLVLFFYPQDDTPTCTQEACAFRDDYLEFVQRGAVVLGVSANSIASHKKFASKYGLQYPLLSDESKKVLKKYGVWKKKNLFGRKYMGIVRTTMVIDATGRVAEIFLNVRVKNHTREVLEVLDRLGKAKSAHGVRNTAGDV